MKGLRCIGLEHPKYGKGGAAHSTRLLAVERPATALQSTRSALPSYRPPLLLQPSLDAATTCGTEPAHLFAGRLGTHADIVGAAVLFFQLAVP